MLVPHGAVRDLATRLDTPAGGLRSASVEVDVDPLELVAAGAGTVGHASFFASPDGYAIGGLGVAQRVVASGPQRLRVLDEATAALDPDLPIVVGFAFDPDGPSGPDWEGFPSALAVVPEVAVVRTSGRSRLIVTVPAGADSRLPLRLLGTLRAVPRASSRDAVHGVEARPGPGDWQDLVRDTVEVIGSGALTKVVLARTVIVRSASPLVPFDLVARLRDRYPSCRLFGWQEGGAAFIGASPELLVARHGSAYRVEPLAGSARRGVDAEEDRRLGDELLASAKDRAEHAIVVDDALARLSPLADEIIQPPQPLLQRLATVQHLATPITGRTGARLLALADVLHPTPAVGGDPRRAALEFIGKVEGIDRGWYAGGIGWADASGDGEIALGLRCALVSGERAVLYAGNGIVAGSDPQAELEESRLKLRPMLDLVTGV
jgi:isochorismate synthase